MRVAFAIGVALHGLIHLLGPAKAFGWAEVTQLRQPISMGSGASWLMAATLLLATAAVSGAGIPVLVSALDLRSTSFRSRFDHDSRAALARPKGDVPRVTEAELSPLPALMQAYLRRVGAIGRPHVRSMRVLFDARMRFSAHSKWMDRARSSTNSSLQRRGSST